MKFSSQMKILIFVVLATLASQSSYAEPKCPTADDLNTGVTFTRSNPLFSELVIRQGSKLKAHRVMSKKGEISEIVSSYTHAVAAEERRSSSSVFTITYLKDPAQLRDLKAMGQWKTDISLFRNSELFSNGEFEAEFVGTSSITIGSCTYDTWTIETTTKLDAKKAPMKYRKDYAPLLGWVLRAVRLAPNGIPVSQVTYDKITIGKLR